MAWSGKRELGQNSPKALMDLAHRTLVLRARSEFSGFAV